MKLQEKLILLLLSVCLPIYSHKSIRSSLSTQAAKSVRNFEENKINESGITIQGGKADACSRKSLRQAFGVTSGSTTTDQGVLPEQENEPGQVFDGTFAITDLIRIDANNNLFGSAAGSVVVNSGDVSITANSFTNFVQDNALTLDITAGTNPVTNPVLIQGNTTLNGTFELEANARLRVEGTLTINGTANDYINIASGATLEVVGAIILDGAQLYNIVNNGTIKTDIAGSIVIRNSRSTATDAVVVNNVASFGPLSFIDNESTTDDGVLIHGAVSAGGAILFRNNKGNDYGVNNSATGTLTNSANNITFVLNCGDTNDVINSGAITSAGASGFIQETVSSLSAAGTITINNNDGAFGAVLRGSFMQASGNIVISDNDGPIATRVGLWTDLTSTGGSITVNNNTGGGGVELQPNLTVAANGDVRFDGNDGPSYDTLLRTGSSVTSTTGVVCYVNQNIPILEGTASTTPALTTC